MRLRDADGSTTPDPAAVAKGFYWMDSGDHEYRPRNTAAARGGLLFADEVATLGGWLGPGQSITGETEVDVNTDQTTATTAVYSVSIAFVTNRQFETPRTCSNDHVSLASASAFEQEVRHPIASSVGGSFICVESEIQPRNVVADLVDESAAEETFLVLADPTVSKESVPYLVTSYLNPHASTSESPAGQLQDTLKIDSENPSIFTRITAVDSWSVPDSTTTSDPIAPFAMTFDRLHRLAPAATSRRWARVATRVWSLDDSAAQTPDRWRWPGRPRIDRDRLGCSGGR